MKTMAYFTDCATFGGCENMLINFLSAHDLEVNYDLKLFFNFSEPYSAGLKKRLSSSDNRGQLIPLRLYSFRFCLKFKNSFLRKACLLFESFVMRYPLFLYNTVYLYHQFKKNKIDLLHVNNGGYPGARTCQAAVLAASMCGIKNIVYVVNNIAFTYRHPSRWLDWPIDQLIKRKPRYFITGSCYARDCLQKVLGLSDKCFKVLANGVSTREIKQERDEFLRSHQLSTDPNTVIAGIVAHLDERKGHIYLLKALLALREAGKSLPLLLIEGEGLEHKKLLRFVKENQLDDKVHFLRSIDNIFDLINVLDFTILSSIANEDFPNITIEAMALGKPVIGTRLAGIPEQIVHNVTGLLVPPRDVEALADAIERLTLDASLRRKMGEKGQQKFKQSYTETAAVSRYLGIYESILEQGAIN